MHGESGWGKGGENTVCQNLPGFGTLTEICQRQSDCSIRVIEFFEVNLLNSIHVAPLRCYGRVVDGSGTVA